MEHLWWLILKGLTYRVTLARNRKDTPIEVFNNLYFCKIHGKTPAMTPSQLFPVNFAKFYRTTFLQNTSGRLLLKWTNADFGCYFYPSTNYSFFKDHVN